MSSAGDDVARHDREHVGPLVERQQYAVVDGRRIVASVGHGFDITGVPDDQIHPIGQPAARLRLVSNERPDG